MKTLVHTFKNDLYSQRFVWLSLLVAGILWILLHAQVKGRTSFLLFENMLMLLGTFPAILAWFLYNKENPAQQDAFWRTRPLAKFQLAASKLLHVLTACLVATGLALIPLYIKDGTALLPHFGLNMLLFCIAASMAAAALNSISGGTLKATLILSGTPIVITFMIILLLVKLGIIDRQNRDALNYGADYSTTVLTLGIIIVGSLIILFSQYHKDSINRSIAIISSIIAIALIASFSWSPNFFSKPLSNEEIARIQLPESIYQTQAWIREPYSNPKQRIQENNARFTIPVTAHDTTDAHWIVKVKTQGVLSLRDSKYPVLLGNNITTSVDKFDLDNLEHLYPKYTIVGWSNRHTYEHPGYRMHEKLPQRIWKEAKGSTSVSYTGKALWLKIGLRHLKSVKLGEPIEYAAHGYTVSLENAKLRETDDGIKLDAHIKLRTPRTPGYHEEALRYSQYLGGRFHLVLVNHIRKEIMVNAPWGNSYGWWNDTFFSYNRAVRTFQFDNETADWDSANTWLDNAELHLIAREMQGYFVKDLKSEVIVQ